MIPGCRPAAAVGTWAHQRQWVLALIVECRFIEHVQSAAAALAHQTIYPARHVQVTIQDSSPHVLDKSALYSGSPLFVAVGQAASGCLAHSNKESLRSAAGAEESRSEGT